MYVFVILSNLRPQAFANLLLREPASDAMAPHLTAKEIDQMFVLQGMGKTPVEIHAWLEKRPRSGQERPGPSQERPGAPQERPRSLPGPSQEPRYLIGGGVR